MSDGAIGEGILAIWTDVLPEHEATFEDWYNRQHLPERRGAPGFLSAARHRAIAGRPRFLAWYRTESPATISAPGYRKLLDNPTPESRAIMPHFRNTIRTVFAVRARAGRGTGGVMATLRLRASPAREAALDRWIENKLPDLAAAPGMLAAELWLRAEEARPNTIEAALRGPDATVERALVLQASHAQAARAALKAIASRDLLRRAGASSIDIGLYRLAADLP